MTKSRNKRMVPSGSVSEATIYIYESEAHAIVGEAQRFPQIETGGDLFGTFTHGNMPVVWLASGPGPNAKHLSTHFEQDVEFMNDWQSRLMNEFAIQYVGSWHSHHTLDLHHPSGGDAAAARNYAVRHHRRRTLEIIVNLEGRKLKTFLRPYFYPNAQEGGWISAKFTTLKGESPLRSKLGYDEVEFSCGVNWREIPSNLFSLSTYEFREERTDIPNRNEMKEIPERIRLAVQNLRYEGVEVEQRGNVFMVIVPIGAEQVIAIAVEDSDELKILQANFIDYAQQTNMNVTQRVPTSSQLRLDQASVTMLADALPLTNTTLPGWRV